VRTLFDTSVLVAAFEVSHPRHTVCLPWLQQGQTEQIHGLIATHTLAELYSVLTRLPVRPRISPELAQRLITENLERFEVIPLTTEDYQMVLAQMVSVKYSGLLRSYPELQLSQPSTLPVSVAAASLYCYNLVLRSISGLATFITLTLSVSRRVNG